MLSEVGPRIRKALASVQPPLAMHPISGAAKSFRRWAPVEEDEAAAR